MPQSTNSCADEFRYLWLTGNAPNIEQFLAQRKPFSTGQLAEILVLDQSLRWHHDESIHCEQYFVRFPELRNDQESAVDLVFSEFLLREQAGLNPEIDEYVCRFPEFDDELRRQAAFHRALGMIELNEDLGEIDRISSNETRLRGELTAAPSIPGYLILGELGRGGIAVVYKALHLQLNRPVALKMLLAGNFASPSSLRRFVVEAEATARLQHPNIVQIYEVGQYEGRPFLALEYINGGTLSQGTLGRPHPPREAAAIIQSLAATAQFAHEQGVLHRDLKPGNVLIQQLTRPRDSHEFPHKPQDFASAKLRAVIKRDRLPMPTAEFSEVKQDDHALPLTSPLQHGFQLKIADFGLAKLIAGDSNAEQLAATMSGDILGTAAYMSPEQARGDIANLTAATDIYSLGAILYELLTGRPPFVGVRPLEVLGQVIADEPVRPANLVRRLPHDIQTICLKCLEKSPSRRYASAGELADDLGRFLQDQPIVARHASTLERSWRWCQRHPVKTSFVASFAAILIIVATISSMYAISLGYQLKLTSEAEANERLSRLQALHQLWESQLSQADAIRSSKQVGQRYDALKAIDIARDLGASINPTSQQIDRMRNATIACLAKPDLRIIGQWKSGEDKLGTLLSVDKRQSIYAFLQSRDHVVIRRTCDGDEIARVAVTNPDSTTLLSENGKRLAILNDYCRVYSLEDELPSLVYETASRGTWAFTSDGSRMLGTAGDGLLYLVDLNSACVVKSFGSIAAKDEIAISPDSNRAAVFDGKTIQVIDLALGQVLLKIDKPEIRGQRHFAWHPNSRYLAIGPFVTEGIELWDVDYGVQVGSYYHDTGELGICFNSTGEQLLTFDAWGGSLLIWNISSGELELSKTGIVVLAISADEAGGFRFLQRLGDGQLSAVAIDHPRIYCSLPIIRPPNAVPSSNDLEYSADGQLLAVVNRGELQIFDAQNYRELDRLACGFCFLQFDRDGSLLTAISTGLARWPLSLVADPEIEISASRSTAHISLGPPVYLSSIAAAARFDISRDGKSIAIPTGNQIQIQPPAPFEPSRTIGPHHDIRRVSISPDGSRVVTGGWGGGKACVWDIATGQCLHTFEEPDCCLVQFSPNGKWLVTNSNKVTLWNAQTWEHIADMPVDGMSVNGVQVCFSPDSRVLAVSDSTARINLFDPVSGRKTAILTDPNGDHVSQMVYNPNGNQLAVMAGNRGGVVHVWDLAAIRDELKQRNLDRSTDDYGPVTLDINAEKKVASAMPNFKISDLKFIPDQLFVENEAVQQDRLLRQSVENFDIMSARSAIKNIIKLQPQRALTCNNLAWTLAVGPQPLRDTKLAVEFARRAIADESLSEANRALYTNTLGVALYRNDRLEEATRILEQSLAIQPAESQPFDLYFLSMCSSRSGNESQARDYFDRAESLVKQFEAMMPVDRRTELVSFSEEAKQLLACRE